MSSASGTPAAGLTVVSGGAFGIDAAVHKAAVAEGAGARRHGGRGLDRLHPRHNVELLEQVIESVAVVWEAPPGTAWTRQRFIARNRLIAALSEATVVVERRLAVGSVEHRTTGRRADATGRRGTGTVTSMA